MSTLQGPDWPAPPNSDAGFFHAMFAVLAGAVASAFTLVASRSSN
jgi:hypothetical protein